MRNSEKVKQFMRHFGQEIKTTPVLRGDETWKLRLSLIDEEVGELRDAIRDKDVVEIADAITDILYVVYGAAHEAGIDIDACFHEVHLSNMSKLGDDGKPIRREDGKILKGENFFRPNLKKVLDL